MLRFRLVQETQDEMCGYITKGERELRIRLQIVSSGTGLGVDDIIGKCPFADPLRFLTGRWESSKFQANAGSQMKHLGVSQFHAEKRGKGLGFLCILPGEKNLLEPLHGSSRERS